MFEACGPYQWAREFLKNALEADATKVEFGIEWQAVEKFGVYRRTIADDGHGMDRNELLRFFSTLGHGAKKIGGIHENFGVGAKIAALPWNPEGVVIVSYKNGHSSLIQIVLEPDSGDYELVEFESGEAKSCVIEPQLFDGIDWSALRPAWLKDHGTIVVLLGSEQYKDTILGNPNSGEKDIKGLSVYLNSRFWDLSKQEVRVLELRSEKKAQWPQDALEKDDARRPNNRQIRGARHYLTDVKAPSGIAPQTGMIALDDERVILEWYLWEGKRPAVDSYAKKGGYIGVRYNDEIFQLTANKAHFRWFGIVESKVQQNLTLILEPQHYQPSNGQWGIHPDQSRNRIIFTGNGEKGGEVPLSDWGTEFLEKMPEAIREAIQKARGDLAGALTDEDYRKRLQDKFGNRWKIKVLVKAHKDDEQTEPASADTEEVEVIGEGVKRRRRRGKVVKILRPRALPSGTDAGVERETPVDVPRFRLVGADEFEKPWHIALWAPQTPDGPTVLINRDSPLLQEVVDYHQAQYPDIHWEEVAITVRQVFGEVAACKVAHSQKLAKKVSEEELNQYYRSEQALTVAMMGLMAEEAVIAQRLGKLGRKKAAGALDERAA